MAFKTEGKISESIQQKAGRRNGSQKYSKWKVWNEGTDISLKTHYIKCKWLKHIYGNRLFDWILKRLHWFQKIHWNRIYRNVKIHKKIKIK